MKSFDFRRNWCGLTYYTEGNQGPNLELCIERMKEFFKLDHEPRDIRARVYKTKPAHGQAYEFKVTPGREASRLALLTRDAGWTGVTLYPNTHRKLLRLARDGYKYVAIEELR